MGEETKAITVRVDPDTFKQVEEMAEADGGRSVPSLVRKMIQDCLERDKEQSEQRIAS